MTGQEEAYVLGGWRVCHCAAGSSGKRPLSLRYQLSDQRSQTSVLAVTLPPILVATGVQPTTPKASGLFIKKIFF